MNIGRFNWVRVGNCFNPGIPSLQLCRISSVQTAGLFASQAPAPVLFYLVEFVGQPGVGVVNDRQVANHPKIPSRAVLIVEMAEQKQVSGLLPKSNFLGRKFLDVISLDDFLNKVAQLPYRSRVSGDRGVGSRLAAF